MNFYYPTSNGIPSPEKPSPYGLNVGGTSPSPSSLLGGYPQFNGLAASRAEYGLTGPSTGTLPPTGSLHPGGGLQPPSNPSAMAAAYGGNPQMHGLVQGRYQAGQLPQTSPYTPQMYAYQPRAFVSVAPSNPYSSMGIPVSAPVQRPVPTSYAMQSMAPSVTSPTSSMLGYASLPPGAAASMSSAASLYGQVPSAQTAMPSQPPHFYQQVTPQSYIPQNPGFPNGSAYSKSFPSAAPRY